VAGDPFLRWIEALEARQRRDLSFAEIRRGLQAVSSLYVERRKKLPGGAVFEGNGKRAAFALYYGALHFLMLREIVRALPEAARAVGYVLDLGCGTGAAGAAWALQAGARCDGVERSGWAAAEARFTLSALGLAGHITRGDLAATELPGVGAGILLAYALNELDAATRSRLKARLLEAHGRGARVLIVEPLARAVAPWWDAWARELSGARCDEWRLRAELPESVRLLGRAAGLDPRELTARSLWLS
jgi:SAM-dependent methyltransferase